MITIKTFDTFASVLRKSKLFLEHSYYMKEKFYSVYGNTETDLVYFFLSNMEELSEDEKELLENLNDLYHVVTGIDMPQCHSADEVKEDLNAEIQEDQLKNWDGNP